MSCVNLHIYLPRNALRIIALLEEGGYEAYAVGGCVRDALLGRAVNDIDICSSALPEQMEPLFRNVGCKVVPTGAAHGTLSVFLNGQCFEVTTYRRDGTYSDGRHPDSVQFSASLEEDLARRDFTINAMAYHPRRGLVDLHGGRADLEAGIIRAVGEPRKRFEEDALRIMRALRFSAQLGFKIEPGTADALRECAPLLERIAIERCTSELLLLLCGPAARIPLLEYTQVLGLILPELIPMKGFDQQNKYHPYDVLEHSVVALEHMPVDPVLRMVALLHDCGKPATFDVSGPNHFNGRQRRHFFGHPQAGAEIALPALERLRLPRDFIDDAAFLIREHDAKLYDDPAKVKSWLRKVGPRRLRLLLWMKRADVSALAECCHVWCKDFDAVETCMDRILADGDCYSLAQLAVNGRDLMDAGMPAGPGLGDCLERLLDRVIAGELPNEREALLAAALSSV